MPSPRRSLVITLACWFSAVSALLVIATTAAIYLQARSYLVESDRSIIRDKLDEYREMLVEGAKEKPIAQEVAEEGTSDSWVNVYVRISDGSGKTLLQTSGFPECREPLTPPGSSPLLRWIHTADGEAHSLGSALVTSSDGPRRVDVLLVNPQTDALLGHYRTVSILAACVSLVVAGLCGILLARRATAPIVELGRMVASIGPRQLSERIASTALPREVASLADHFNVMLGRLQEGFERLDRFSSDIAHELRTPVNLRVVAEVAMSKEDRGERTQALASVLEESQRLATLIDTLLLLARVEDANAQMITETIDLGRESRVLSTYYEVSASDRGIILSCDVADGALLGNRMLFQRLVGNLIENAIAHTPAGGTISIHSAVGSDRTRLRIVDTGEGIAADQLPHVFDRFRRATRDASGRVGLGLPIARAIARLHRGDVTLSSVPGHGTTAEIELPLMTVPSPTR